VLFQSKTPFRRSLQESIKCILLLFKYRARRRSFHVLEFIVIRDPCSEEYDYVALDTLLTTEPCLGGQLKLP
jgi:hypothetical protein